MNPDWKDYERQIFHLICSEYLGAEVRHDSFIVGKKSKRKRQIDVEIILSNGGKPILGIGECRNIGRKISLTTIDGVIGKMSDVGAKFAIVVTTKGYSASAKTLADNSKIEIKVIPYEFLKDFGYMGTLDLDHDYHMEEVEYDPAYCKKCDTTNLYEVKVVRGFADHEWMICPKCKVRLYETRTDGGHRVIKRFLGKNVPPEEIEKVIVDHLLWTRDSWDRAYSFEAVHFNDVVVKGGRNCEICHKRFNNSSHHSTPYIYKNRKICIECMMSSRNLLIDYGKV